jgi:hypothetical protein
VLVGDILIQWSKLVQIVVKKREIMGNGQWAMGRGIFMRGGVPSS